MKVLSLLILSCLTVFSLDSTKPILESISEYSIKIGEGKTKVYAFVDPLCPLSKALISSIHENKKLQEQNTYHIFVYSFPIFDSQEFVQHIFNAKNKKTALINIMVYEDFDNVIDEEDFVLKKEISANIQTVAKAITKMKINISPYVISYERGALYCQASDSKPSCLEENSWDD